MTQALLLIDLQNDYFAGGSYPLWNTEQTSDNIRGAIAKPQRKGMPIVHIQHVADSAAGISPMFNEGTDGVNIHASILAAAPDAPVVTKTFADSFEKTELEATLTDLGATELLVCGMMTQNCVTHTAISKAADKYDVTVVTDCCTTVDEMLHMIALHALSTRVKLLPADEAI